MRSYQYRAFWRGLYAKTRDSLGIVLVLLITVAAVVRFNVNGYRLRIQAQLGQKLNRNVTMDDVSLRLFPPTLR
jgi:uncharacterized protein involved in outer membrane biogenesis